MTEQTHDPAPAPWNWEASGKAGSNGLFNLYITDANGRKIAAVWGKPGEKEATCRMMVAAPELLAASQTIVGAVSRLQLTAEETAAFALLDAAIAYATDDGAADMAAPLAPRENGDANAMARG